MPDKEDQTAAISRWWIIPTLLTGAGVGFFLRPFGPPLMAEVSGMSAGVFVFMMRVWWRQRSNRWFWPLMITLGLGHLLAIALIHWSPAYKISKGDLLFVWVDFFLYAALGIAAEKAISVGTANQDDRPS
jgi:hypothetical protein